MKIWEGEKNTFACQEGTSYPSQALCRCAARLRTPPGGSRREIRPLLGEAGSVAPPRGTEGLRLACVVLQDCGFRAGNPSSSPWGPMA